MVVFVDLESSDDEPSINLRARLGISPREGLVIQARSSVNSESAERAGKEQSHSFAAILTCYPAALSLSSHLDLNDLYSLSLTCRSLHTSLIQYASQLTANSLRCSLDSTGTARASSCEDTKPNRIATRISTSHGSLGLRGITAPWTAKWKPCARDLVAPCRRCGIVICRNCSAKAPSDRYLTERYRRLCQTCLEAPLEEHLQPLRHDEIAVGDTPPSSSSSSARSVPSSSETISETDPMARHLEDAPNEQKAFSCPAFIRKPCDCASNGVHLCWDCGHNLRSNDTTYRRVWTWRSRYSTHMGGGIGTGLGLGNQGQKCGRGEHCLDSGAESVAWVEIDCSENTAAGSSFEQDVLMGTRSATLTIDRSTPSPMGNRPGYYSQEVEGIGGVVKKKVKKRVKVGAAVYEWDDERKSGKYLDRESSGKERSWCGWCGRVCLRRADSQAQAQSIR